MNNSNNKTKDFFKTASTLSMIFSIIGLVSFVALPVTTINLGMTQKTSALSGLFALFQSKSILTSPGYVGNGGVIITGILLALFLIVIVGGILNVISCFNQKKSLYKTGLTMAVVSMLFCFVVLLLTPYIVPNSLGRKAYLFTEFAKAWKGLGIGYWVSILSFGVSGILIAKRDAK